MQLSRKNFVKALFATAAAPQISSGVDAESEKAIRSMANRISAVDAAALMKNYRVAPIPRKPGTFEFNIGTKRYKYGFISRIDWYGLVFPTKERHRAVISLPDSGSSLQAVRIEGKWHYLPGSHFPHDFPIDDFASAIERLGKQL